MIDYNQILTPGKIEEGIINTVIEVSEGSILKIEYRRNSGAFELDRVEPSIFPKPANYGFIPQTLDGDGDELDTLVICAEPIPTGVYLQAKVIGILIFEDDNEIDHKIICVPLDDRNTGNNVASLENLGERWKQKIEFHFNRYKDLKKPGTTKVVGWGSAQAAQKVIQEAMTRYQSSK